MFTRFQIVEVKELIGDDWVKAIILQVVHGGGRYKVRSLDNRDKLALVTSDKVRALASPS